MLLYHAVPDYLVGENIVPLTALKIVSPEIYQNYNKKYSWWPNVPEQNIYPLHCLWNDVIFLLPVPPQEVRELRKSFGMPWMRKKFFVIPSEMLAAENATMFLHDHATERSFVEYNEENIKTNSVLSLSIRGKYMRWMTTGKRPIMLWAGIPHILYKGEIPWKNLEIIEV